LREELDAIINRYLKGDQRAPERAAFERCDQILDQLRQNNVGSAYDESRQLFCRARALLFDRRPAIRRSSFATAIELLDRSLRLDPNRAYAFNALGIGLLEAATADGSPPADATQYLRSAEEAFRDAIDRAPYWPYPRHNLALTLAQMGRFDEAIRTYEEAIDLRPDYFYLRYNLALLLQKMNETDRASTTLRGAIRTAEQYRVRLRPAPPQLTELAAAYNAMGTLQRSHRAALRWFDRAVSEDPTYAPARHNRALILRRRGNLGEAIAEWERVLAIEKDFTAAELELAVAQSESGAHDRAIPTLREIYAGTGSVGAARQLALAYARAGRLPEAESLLTEVLDRYPKLLDVLAEREDIRRLHGCKSPRTKAYRGVGSACGKA
jgi:tetratricopeptide (TPR) repeat protein